MIMFYKGYQVELQDTGIVGGVLIKHGKESHTVARKGYWNGNAFSDLHGVQGEIKAMIDNGTFRTIKQIPEHKF